MTTQWQRDNDRQVSIPIALSNSINMGDLVAVSSGLAVSASQFNWTTDLATTQAAFTAAFAGVSKQAKNANQPLKFNGTQNQLNLQTATAGVFRVQVASGTYAVGQYVGPAQNGSTNALLDQVFAGVTDAAHAVARIESIAGGLYSGAVNPAWVEVRIFSTLFPEGANR